MSNPTPQKHKATIIKAVIHLIVVVGLWVICDNFTNHVSYDNLKDLIDILKNASAMIFTIVGIWLAYVYPNAITALVNPDSIDFVAGEKDKRRIEMLVSIIITSAIVIIGIICFFIAKTALTGSSFYTENIEFWRTLGFTTIFTLSYFQILCILKVISSNIIFINDLHSKFNDQKIEEQM
ncbi:hypothetical protein [Vibrio lentus]|uniref:hypothetical protein n=1 Tax=Vibrio lentus TaxID=136468 RepID=UPI001055454A|nr:hypothetical protein [Vibrio lentus]